MRAIRKKIVTDENSRPVAVQIDYADWLEIERALEPLFEGHPRKLTSESQADVAPMSGSIRWQGDLVSPIEESWEAE